MTLKIGQLYCVREDPLILMNRPDGNNVVTCIDTYVPFLVLEVEGRYCQVLFKDKKGWTEIHPSLNPAVEIYNIKDLIDEAA